MSGKEYLDAQDRYSNDQNDEAALITSTEYLLGQASWRILYMHFYLTTPNKHIYYFPILKMQNFGSKRSSYLFKITQLGSDIPRNQTQIWVTIDAILLTTTWN